MKRTLRAAALPILACLLPAQDAAPAPRTAPAAVRVAVIGGGPFATPDAAMRLQQAVVDVDALDADFAIALPPCDDGGSGAWHAALARLRTPWAPPPGAKAPLRAEVVAESPHGRAMAGAGHWFVALADTAIADDPAALAWLQATLTLAKGRGVAGVVLAFPRVRWAGADAAAFAPWHAAIAASGVVRAVLAGGAAGARRDEARDGVAYYALPSLGDTPPLDAPAAGFGVGTSLFTVRGAQVRATTVALGAARDLDRVSPAVSEGALAVAAGLAVELDRALAAGGGDAVGLDGRVDATVVLRFRNPAGLPIDVEATPIADGGWTFAPDHEHLVVPPQGVATTRFTVRKAASPGEPFALPLLRARADLRTPAGPLGLPPIDFFLPLPPPAALGRERAAAAGALALDGEGAALRASGAQTALDGPGLTLEAWARPDDVSGRRTIASKGRGREVALAVDDGAVVGEVAVRDGIARARTATGSLARGRWTHVAVVHDGATLRVYLDGRLAAATPAIGARSADDGPFLVGAALAADGALRDGFAGLLDDVRLCRVARYAADFAPAANHEPDADTVLLLPCDADFGPWTTDRSGHGAHPRRLGTAHCTRTSR
ncbi:MAG: LamG domain-containing protein [Phycisphaerales bacterium]|nr:LamG domain-containing protein [Phycisphaerales bacterium]